MDAPDHDDAYGEEEDLETQLGRVVAPLFDLAIHLQRRPEVAADGVVSALKALVLELESEKAGQIDPLLIAARHLVTWSRGLGVLNSKKAMSSPMQGALDKLEDGEREAVIVSAALGLGGEDLAQTLSLPLAAAQKRFSSAYQKLQCSESEVEVALDQDAALWPLVRGMIDRALDDV